MGAVTEQATSPTVTSNAGWTAAECATSGPSHSISSVGNDGPPLGACEGLERVSQSTLFHHSHPAARHFVASPATAGLTPAPTSPDWGIWADYTMQRGRTGEHLNLDCMLGPGSFWGTCVQWCWVSAHGQVTGACSYCSCHLELTLTWSYSHSTEVPATQVLPKALRRCSYAALLALIWQVITITAIYQTHSCEAICS